MGYDVVTYYPRRLQVTTLRDGYLCTKYPRFSRSRTFEWCLIKVIMNQTQDALMSEKFVSDKRGRRFSYLKQASLRSKTLVKGGSLGPACQNLHTLNLSSNSGYRASFVVLTR